ncbi:hypothetical protein [Anaeromyxobacter sp. SG26]|uniref:hypothetical protein n=1 Tax=Anaeromyxobacter sp. SG26 TaxID=2925407 RepID=UPI001F56819E|nr:hypothetical protein [Anaeromyxobacter sp. SG26]
MTKMTVQNAQQSPRVHSSLLRRISFALAALALAGSAAADVTFDPATGQGFVGKGDVQTPFAWNNAMLQSYANAVAFSYESEAVYDVTCEKEGKKTTLTKHFKRSRASELSIQFETRNNKKQVTGFFLIGYGDEVESTVDGSDICPASDNDIAWVEVPGTRVTLSSTSARLYVTFGASRALLY